MIERVLSGCVTRGNQNRLTPDGEPRMSYTEFVWFLLAEEDKTHPTAIEYWFRYETTTEVVNEKGNLTIPSGFVP